MILCLDCMCSGACEIRICDDIVLSLHHGRVLSQKEIITQGIWGDLRRGTVYKGMDLGVEKPTRDDAAPQKETVESY